MKYELATVLSRLHGASGMSQEDAAAMIRRWTGEAIHQTAFSAYLATSDRHRVPSVLSAGALALAYDVSIEYLLGWVKDRRPVAALLERLRELAFPAPIEDAAKKLAAMPDAYQRKHVAAIESDFDAWQREKRWNLLAQFVPEEERRRILNTVVAGMDITEHVDSAPETLFELA